MYIRVLVTSSPKTYRLGLGSIPPLALSQVRIRQPKRQSKLLANKHNLELRKTDSFRLIKYYMCLSLETFFSGPGAGES